MNKKTGLKIERILKMVYYSLGAVAICFGILAAICTSVGVMFFGAIELNSLGFPLVLFPLTMGLVMVFAPYVVSKALETELLREWKVRMMVYSVGIVIAVCYAKINLFSGINDFTVLMVLMGVA